MIERVERVLHADRKEIIHMLATHCPMHVFDPLQCRVHDALACVQGLAFERRLSRPRGNVDDSSRLFNEDVVMRLNSVCIMPRMKWWLVHDALSDEIIYARPVRMATQELFRDAEAYAGIMAEYSNLYVVQRDELRQVMGRAMTRGIAIRLGHLPANDQKYLRALRRGEQLIDRQRALFQSWYELYQSFPGSTNPTNDEILWQWSNLLKRPSYSRDITHNPAVVAFQREAAAARDRRVPDRSPPRRLTPPRVPARDPVEDDDDDYPDDDEDDELAEDPLAPLMNRLRM